MDRIITYPVAQPTDGDLLNGNKFAYRALAALAEAVFGQNTIVNGLNCTQSLTPALNVLVGTGEIYKVGDADTTAYGSLPADTTQILKQGFLSAALTLATPAPVTVGQSTNYLIQASLADSDLGVKVFKYFNSANPLQSLSGPSGLGASQPSIRTCNAVVSVKAGTPATTGTQVTPAPDAGYVGLYSVTVANGQTTVLNTNIVKLSSFPSIPVRLQYAASATAGETVISSMPNPAVEAAYGQMAVTPNAVGGSGGNVSIAAGIYFNLGKEVITATTAIPTIAVTTAFTSVNLTASTSYFLRAQYISGVLTFYTQQGLLTDAIPASKKGTPNAVTGGGFQSTPIDICIAQIITGVNGTVPAVRKIVNSANTIFTNILNGSGTLLLPIDPFSRSIILNVGIPTPHPTLISNFQHNSAGWTGYAAANNLVTSGTLTNPLANQWGTTTAPSITSAGIAGDITIVNVTGSFDHALANSFWLHEQREHTVGDNTQANGDEFSRFMATKTMQAADYTNGMSFAYTNCLNVVTTWSLQR